MQTRIVEMHLERETKGAVRYQEVGGVNFRPLTNDEENALVVNLYLRKKQLNGSTPKRIRVTIEEIVGEIT